MYVCIYIYIYTWLLWVGSLWVALSQGPTLFQWMLTGIHWVALLVQRYLSNAASFCLHAVYSVKDHHDLQTICHV